MAQSLQDPHAVAAVVSALRRAHGDHIARTMLTEGMTLASLIDAFLSSPLHNREAIKLIVRALESGDFIFAPDLGPLWHLKYVYENRPGSFHVVDMTIATPDGTIASTALRLRLR